MQLSDEREQTFQRKSPTWPHKRSKKFKGYIKKLVEAGFSFAPTNSQTDRCVCYLCGACTYDWDPEEEPFFRHSQISPTCPLVLLYESDPSKGNSLLGEETMWSKTLLQARIRTFGDWWPLAESKTCSVDQMANAGFSYNPDSESMDNVQCIYCGVQLDGWEDGDDPSAEHLRRRPDCKYLCQPTIIEKKEEDIGTKTKKRTRKKKQSSDDESHTSMISEMSKADGNSNNLPEDPLEPPTKRTTRKTTRNTKTKTEAVPVDDINTVEVLPSASTSPAKVQEAPKPRRGRKKEPEVKPTTVIPVEETESVISSVASSSPKKRAARATRATRAQAPTTQVDEIAELPKRTRKPRTVKKDVDTTKESTVEKKKRGRKPKNQSPSRQSSRESMASSICESEVSACPSEISDLSESTIDFNEQSFLEQSFLSVVNDEKEYLSEIHDIFGDKNKPALQEISASTIENSTTQIHSIATTHSITHQNTDKVSSPIPPNIENENDWNYLLDSSVKLKSELFAKLKKLPNLSKMTVEQVILQIFEEKINEMRVEGERMRALFKLKVSSCVQELL